MIKKIALGAVIFSLSAMVFALPLLPDQSRHIHNGVASCAGSTCHGAVRQFANSNILHNEFITWTRKDRHAKAYQTLLTKESGRIAQKLGLGAPQNEPLCLDCHASNVSNKYRGKKFQISDGIGCESCHGGSEQWLSSHASEQAQHGDNVSHGLYPTDDPAAKAKLCLSCHYGNDDKFVTHQLIGAGHPRLSFELDTFTELMPPHFEYDEDYRKRKQYSAPVTTWAVGQAVAVEQQFLQLKNRSVQSHKMFPELAFFDCHSCHHQMSDVRWRAHKRTGLGPGEVRLQDASLIMLRSVLLVIDQPKAIWLQQKIRQLHQASGNDFDDYKKTINEMQAILPELTQYIRGHVFKQTEVQTIIENLIDDGVNGHLQDYIAAEQATMAIAGLLATLDEMSVFDKVSWANVNTRLDQLYLCVENDEKYRSACFVKALKKFDLVFK